MKKLQTNLPAAMLPWMLALALTGHAAAADYLWDGSTSTWGALDWTIPPSVTLVAGPTASGNTATINGGTVSFTQHDTFGNAGITTSPALTIGTGGLLNNSGGVGGWFNTIWNLTLSGGTIQAVGGDSNWYAYGIAGTVTVNGGSPSSMTSNGAANARFDLRTSGTIFNVADVTGDANADLLVSGVLSNGNSGSGSWNVGSLTKTGAGTMSLSAVNTYTGTTLVTGGILEIASGGSVTTSGKVNTQSGGTISITGTLTMPGAANFDIGGGLTGTTGYVVVNNGGVLNIGASNGTNVGYTGIGGSDSGGGGQKGIGTLTINTGGTVNVAAGGTGPGGLDGSSLWLNPYGNNGTSTLNVNGGTIVTARPIQNGSSNSVVNFDGGTLKAGAAIGMMTLNANVRNGGAIVDTNGYNPSLAYPLVHSTIGGDNATDGGLTKKGNGILTLSGASTFTGPTIVQQGTLAFSGGGTSNSAGTITVQNGGLMRMDRNDTWGIQTTTATPVITVDTGGILQSNSTYVTLIGLVLNGGTLSANGGVNANYPAFGLRGTVTVNATSGGSFISTTGTGTYNNVSVGNGAGTVPTTFDVAEGAAASDLTVSVPFSNMSGAINGIIKTGAGTMTLTANSLYTGTTAVNAGTLRVNGNNSAATGAVTVSGTGILDGTGTVGGAVTIQSGGTVDGTLTLGAVTVAGGTLQGTGTCTGATLVQSGGNISPAGSGMGLITCSNSLSLAGNATFQINKSGSTLTSDLVTGMSSVSYGGTLTVAATGDTLAIGDKFYLFSAASYAGAFTTPSLPPLPAGLSWNLDSLTVDGSIIVTNTVMTPLFSPLAGGYVGALSVTISSEAGSTIYYTTDGTTPTPSSPSGPSPVTGVVVPTDTVSMTIQAFAKKSGQMDSPVASATFSTITNPYWNVNDNGIWSAAAKWKNNVIPDGAGVIADFHQIAQSGPATVTLDGSRTVGGLVFGNTNNYDWLLNSTGGAQLTLDNGGAVAVISVLDNSASVSVLLAGGAGFSKTGAGKLTLANSANTFAGDVSIDVGTVELSGSLLNTNPAYTTLGVSGSSGNVYINSGATLLFSAHDQLGNAATTNQRKITVSGGTIRGKNSLVTLGNLELNGGTMTADGGAAFTGANYGAFQLNGYVAVTGSTPSVMNDTGAAGSRYLLNRNGGTTSFDVADVTGDANPDLTISTAIANGWAGTSVGLSKVGAGTLRLTADCYFTGATTAGNGTLELAGGTFGSTSRTDVNNGATYLVSGGSKSGGLIDVNAGGTYTQTGGNVTVTTQMVVGAHGTSAGSISAGTLQVNAPFYIGGYSTGSGTGTFTQTGGTVGVTGQVAFNGNGPNNGIYNLNGGELHAFGIAKHGGTGTATFNFNGGVLYPTTASASYLLGLDAANLLAGGATLNTNTYDITVAQPLLHDSSLGATPDGGLTKQGDGTLALTGASTYTGPTTVSGGILRVDGSLGLGATTIGNAASLQGIGSLAGNLSVAGTVAPGNGVGTLATGATTITGSYVCEIDGSSADQLAVTGDLTLTGATLTINEINPATSLSYVIATFTGTRTGTFASVNGLPTGYALDYGTAGQIKLVKSGFDSWASAHGLTGPDADFNADPDHDGIPNGIEFVLGTEPNPANAGAATLNLPTSVIDGDDLVFTYTRNDDSAYLNPTVEFSDSLASGSWTTAADPANATIKVTDGSPSDTVEVRIHKGAHTKLFARLKVSL